MCVFAALWASKGVAGLGAKKFALRAQNTPNLAFLCSLGEFFAEEPLERLCWVTFFRATEW